MLSRIGVCFSFIFNTLCFAVCVCTRTYIEIPCDFYNKMTGTERKRRFSAYIRGIYGDNFFTYMGSWWCTTYVLEEIFLLLLYCIQKTNDSLIYLRKKKKEVPFEKDFFYVLLFYIYFHHQMKGENYFKGLEGSDIYIQCVSSLYSLAKQESL